VKQLLKYARKQLHTPQRSMVNMSDATLRDIGLSRSQLNRVSNQSRFDNPLNTLHAQSSMYYPR
ncbi:MAG: DUF1127 domain-containing protein, partial [Pseudomonadota bacterium]